MGFRPAVDIVTAAKLRQLLSSEPPPLGAMNDEMDAPADPAWNVYRLLRGPPQLMPRMLSVAATLASVADIMHRKLALDEGVIRALTNLPAGRPAPSGRRLRPGMWKLCVGERTRLYLMRPCMYPGQHEVEVFMASYRMPQRPEQLSLAQESEQAWQALREYAGSVYERDASELAPDETVLPPLKLFAFVHWAEQHGDRDAALLTAFRCGIRA